VADFGRTGKGDLIDVHVPRDRATGRRAVSRKNVHDAFRKTGFKDQLADTQRAQRSLFSDF